MPDCNHWLGWLNQREYDENLYLDNYVDLCNRQAETAEQRNNYIIEKRIELTCHLYPLLKPEEYIDKRRGFAKLFNHCPNCGAKLDWPKLRKQLKDPR